MECSVATIYEVASIKQLAREAIRHSVKVDAELMAEIVEDTDQHIDGFMQQMSGVFLTCHEGDALLGFVIVKDFWNLSDLYVSPAEQGKGVARMLLKKAMQICQAKGDGRAIRCNSSFNAVGFYKRMGFVDFQTDYPFPDYVVPLVHHG